MNQSICYQCTKIWRERRLYFAHIYYRFFWKSSLRHNCTNIYQFANGSLVTHVWHKSASNCTVSNCMDSIQIRVISISLLSQILQNCSFENIAMHNNRHLLNFHFIFWNIVYGKNDVGKITLRKFFNEIVKW